MTASEHLNPASRDGTGVEAGLSGRLRQWIAQLPRCLPPALRVLLIRDRRCLIIEPAGAQAQLTLILGETRHVLGELSLAALETLPARLAEFERKPLDRIELFLDASEVLIREVSFPAQVRANLHRVVRNELDRLSPFAQDAVYHDVRVHPAPKRAARLDVELALCRRDHLQPWIARCAAIGLPVTHILWPGAWVRANLLPAEERRRRRRIRWNPDAALLVLAGVLLVALIAIPLWHRQQQLAALDAQLLQARRAAIEVDGLRQELERERLGTRTVIEQKLGEPRLLDILLELTERLPDDTWLQTFEYKKDGTIEMRGESAQATALIAVLEQSPRIEGVTFRSPVTQVGRTGKERFNIAFRLIVDAQ